MKNITLFASMLIWLMGAGCKGQQKTNSEPVQTSEPYLYKGVTDQNCAVEVAFGSYGSGIDGAAFEKIQAAIEKRKLASTSKNIGREGETRICLPLTELKAKEKNEFIEQLKSIAKEAQLVSVSVR